jgi:hypothetical protein
MEPQSTNDENPFDIRGFISPRSTVGIQVTQRINEILEEVFGETQLRMSLSVAPAHFLAG